MIALETGGIYIADVGGIVDHRAKKHCVCVSVGAGKYLFINTEHREMYDDIKLNASDYNFFNGVNRHLACSKPRVLEAARLKRKVGVLTKSDIDRLAEKVIKSRIILKSDKDLILVELHDALNKRQCPSPQQMTHGNLATSVR